MPSACTTLSSDRAVARVLRDLPAAELAFLREPLEVRPDDRQQLQDDRRADVRHDAEREDRHLRQVLAREHVVQAEHRVLAPGRPAARAPRGSRPGVGMWLPMRYTASSPSVNSTRLRRSRDGEDVLQAVDHGVPGYARTSAVPPAAAIFSAALPLNLCARTVSAFAMSPRASTLIWPGARRRGRARAAARA